jgi:hypothetical protein
MFGKITVAVAVVLALFAATVRLPATPCLVTNTPNEEACQPDCCANKACCATSHDRTGPPVQPVAKSNPDQQNIATLHATIAVAMPVQVANPPQLVSNVEWRGHSPAPLQLICIRLI